MITTSIFKKAARTENGMPGLQEKIQRSGLKNTTEGLIAGLAKTGLSI